MDLSRYLDLFVSESRDHLGAASESCARLQGSPADGSVLRELFRHVHSLKGMAASMGYSPMTSLAHAAEGLLERLRASGGEPAPEIFALLHESFRCLGGLVDQAERREAMDEARVTPLAARLARAVPDAQAPSGDAERAPAARARPNELVWRVAMILERDRPFPAVRAAIVLGRLARLGRIVRSEPAMAELRTGRFDGRLSVHLDSNLGAEALGTEIARIDDVATFGLSALDAPPAPTVREGPVAWVRVRADLLDALLHHSTELVREHARLDAQAQHEPSSDLRRASERCRALTGRMHSDLLELRLSPIESLANRLSLGVGELARDLGKRIDLEIDGRDVKLDRSILDAISDPILALLRNAVDHGIEPSAEREANGKNPVGKIRLSARRLGERVEITVGDDGRGLDPSALRRRAVEGGFMSAADAAGLSGAEARRLITLPGFSTSSRPSEISGRGVGMDVVRSAVEGLGGYLTVDGAPGEGTRVSLTVPLTLSCVQSLIVRAAGEFFAIPVSAVEGVVADGCDGRVATAEGVETITLAARLGLPVDSGPPPPFRPRLLFRAGGRPLALEVDEIVGRAEILLKPLRPPLRHLVEYAGSALAEDGSITLVVDPAGLAGSLADEGAI